MNFPMLKIMKVEQNGYKYVISKASNASLIFYFSISIEVLFPVIEILFPLPINIILKEF